RFGTMCCVLQAEDGIRGRIVTGVQTWALTIWSEEWGYRENLENSQIFTAESAGRKVRAFLFSGAEGAPGGGAVLAAGKAGQESSAEERRGGDAGRGSGRQDDGQQGEPRNDGRT